MSKLLPNGYAALLAAVKARVRAAQYDALRAVNRELVGLYWDIGQMIVERQTDAAHGAAIAQQLAADLRMEFPGVNGYSRRNVFYMREFFLAYRDQPKVQPLVAQIGWTQNLIILQHPVHGEEPHSRRVRPVRRPQSHRRHDVPDRQTPAQGAQRHVSRTGRDRQAAGGHRMSAIEGFRDVRTEPADLNKEAVDLEVKIQTNFEEFEV